MSQLRSDKPISKKEDDFLNRYPFAARIADRIKNSKQGDSIVIGIYGEWGTGKTSVMKFIQEELSKDDEYVLIDFNPWRFPDEKTLLQNFFKTIAAELHKKLNADDDNKIPKKKGRRNKKPSLLNTGERIAEEVSKYGKLLSFLNAGESIEAFSDLTSPDIVTLKARLEKLISDSKKKLVIFIDDIDRLEKEEIHAIFRLVKLIADFSNTFYLLAFDSDMVASAIGKRFGEGNKQAGLNFIEKIIQVPLSLPVAQSSALRRYCLELVDKTLSENRISLSEDELKRFSSEFSENVMIRLKSPRFAIRYFNSISFIVPILKGEINIVDLLLLEALRIFYPEHFEFLKNNQTYFVLTNNNPQAIDLNLNHDERDKDFNDQLQSLGKTFTFNERNAVLFLLKALFPKLIEDDNNINNQSSYTTWDQQKRVAIALYLKTYFSMTVLESEISDVLFQEVITSSGTVSNDELLSKMKEMINSGSVDTFLQKIRNYGGDLNWQQTKEIILSISKLGVIFPRTESFIPFGLGSPDRQAAFFIYQSLKKHN